MDTKTDFLTIEVKKNIYELNNYNSLSFKIFPQIFVLCDSSGVNYFSEQRERQNEEKLIKARLYLHLIEQCKYPHRLIELEKYVKIGSQDEKKYMEAAMVIKDNTNKLRMIFEISSFDDYEKNRDKAVCNLFILAKSLSKLNQLQYLVYFSRAFKAGKELTKIMVIDYAKFNSFTAWKKFGCQSEEIIPSYVKNF